MDNIKIKDISNPGIQLADLSNKDFIHLPYPFDKEDELPQFKQISQSAAEKFDATLDGVVANSLPKPESKEKEQELINKFISGVKKLFTKENNWTFLMPLIISMEHCARCQSCNSRCNVYEGSNYKEIYRPTYRGEILRRLYYKYGKNNTSIFRKFRNGDIEVNWTMISRLYELSYRCTLCRRCAQSCPIGVDNGLITRELRKIFSSEMGLAPKELHEKGTIQQLKVGSSTGMTPNVVKDNMAFIDEDASERTGFEVKTRWDVEGADFLLIHNAGEILSWPDNPAAFSILLDKAGISWTMSSEIVGFDGVNYGLFYDDFQYARVVQKHLEIAKKLKVKYILMGECGHESKAMSVIADRIFADAVPRIPAFTLLEDIVFNKGIKFDPQKNYFPVTLHDPCNLVRSMGVVEPQRKILRYLAPKFREMEPHGVNNYCCGGGSGFAIMSGNNFADWRINVAGRKKFKQILDAFQDEEMTKDNPKLVVAPCSNCKGQIRDILNYFSASEKAGIYYNGLAELIVNALTDLNSPFINFDEEF